MKRKYCVDASVFLSAWNLYYPPDVFQSLWKVIREIRNCIEIIKPVYDEIYPGAVNKVRSKKYSLRDWMDETGFQIINIDKMADVPMSSIQLEDKYKIKKHSPRGAGENDITLIAYSKLTSRIVVTAEARQNYKPAKLYNYKIPLICLEEGVECIDFVEMLRRLNVEI